MGVPGHGMKQGKGLVNEKKTINTFIRKSTMYGLRQWGGSLSQEKGRDSLKEDVLGGGGGGGEVGGGT